MALVEVKVPDIGDFKEVEVIEVMVKPGDTIAVDQSLLTVESDKASMEIPSSHAGVVKELRLKVGDKISEGTVVLTVEGTGEGGVQPPKATAAAIAAIAPETPPAPSPGSSRRSARRPSVRSRSSKMASAARSRAPRRSPRRVPPSRRSARPSAT